MILEIVQFSTNQILIFSKLSKLIADISWNIENQYNSNLILMHSDSLLCNQIYVALVKDFFFFLFVRMWTKQVQQQKQKFELWTVLSTFCPHPDSRQTLSSTSLSCDPWPHVLVSLGLELQFVQVGPMNMQML